MKESIEIRETFEASPKEIYNAWLNSEKHSQMTGGEATCNDVIGDSFQTWDGYITGQNIELVPNKTIVQSWRTSEFSEDDEDSTLKIQLHSIENGTELTLTQTNIPSGQTQYEQGWIDHYFTPMKKYFCKK